MKYPNFFMELAKKDVFLGFTRRSFRSKKKKMFGFLLTNQHL